MIVIVMRIDLSSGDGERGYGILMRRVGVADGVFKWGIIYLFVVQ
jgi:hypothetical protein